MPEQQLHDILLKLDQELRSGAQIAEEDRQLLQQVKGDLEAVLAKRPATVEPEDESIRERVGSALDRFKADHPGLSNLMSVALDALNKLGV